MLENIFLPLFEVTVNPASRPQLHCFLSQVRPAAVLSNITLTRKNVFRHCWQGCLTKRLTIVANIVLRYLAQFRSILSQ